MLVSGLDQRLSKASFKAEFRYRDGQLSAPPPATLDELETFERNAALATELNRDLTAARQAAAQVRALDGQGGQDLNPDPGIVVTGGPVAVGPRSGPASSNGESFELRWTEGPENGRLTGRLGATGAEEWKASFNYAATQFYDQRTYSREATLTVDPKAGTASYEQAVTARHAFDGMLTHEEVGTAIQTSSARDFLLKDGRLQERPAETFADRARAESDSFVGALYNSVLEFVTGQVEALRSQDNGPGDLDPAPGVIRTKSVGTLLGDQPAEGDMTLRLDGQGQPVSLGGERSLKRDSSMPTTFTEQFNWNATPEGSQLIVNTQARKIKFAGSTVAALHTCATLNLNESQGTAHLDLKKL